MAMGNSQYWTSLWIVGLFILFGFFCLFLGSSIFVFLYERLSTSALWNSPIWLKLKIPIIILCVIAFLAAVIALIRHQGQRELKVAQEYAQSQGWGFTRDDTEGLTAKAAEVLSQYKFNLYHIRTVETGRRNLYLIDCCYNHLDASARKNWNYGTICLVQSDRFNSIAVPVEITTRDWTEVMLSDKVDMGETPFAQQFLVQSKDHDLAKRMVNESIQAILHEQMNKPLSYRFNVIIGPGGAVVMTGQTAEPEVLQDILELSRKLESSMR
jgi:hypothetical protein